jgi:ribonuclease R
VHIADVSRFVAPGGGIDREAFARGTSIYLPRQVIPMLPHAISSGVASLREGEDRLVQSVGIDYSRDAEVTATRFAAGVIRSAARLTYEEAAEAMEDGRRLAARGAAGEKVKRLLDAVAPLARKLTERRIARGALDLDLPEVEVRPGEGVLPATLHARERTASHRLIEEFMLAANEAVARRLAAKEVPAIYRVHDSPDRADVEEVEETLAALGAGRKAGRSMAARLQHLLNRFRGRPEEGIVARHVLRAMKLARYSEIRSDHFGLALSHYTHFTSPIRRYPDLIVHRILKGVSEPRPARGGKDLAPPRLAEVAAESSRLERRAEEAERALDDILMAQHVRARLGEIFEGRVAGIVKTGIFVQIGGKGLPEGAVEGFAPSAVASSFVLTEPVRVALEAVDLLRGRLRLELI